MTASAIVFAYHNVGVRCLSVLLNAGVDVRLVVTHTDNPNETIWFDSVTKLAAQHNIPTIAPPSGDSPELMDAVQQIAPDFIFSFYYRHMLPVAVLQLAKRGAYNMHGSLLPKYRGRVPINWAIIHGETETGATLHEMVAKPDAGRLAGQMAVPILINDTAKNVFDKVTVAAELVLSKALPGLIDCTLQLTYQDLSQGSYFGGRKPEDGRIDWSKTSLEIHNLIRAVAPPHYPGAWTEIGGQRVIAERSQLLSLSEQSALAAHASPACPNFVTVANKQYAQTGDGWLQVST
jgi:methionyl-tRNA formyltransferase